MWLFITRPFEDITDTPHTYHQTAVSVEIIWNSLYDGVFLFLDGGTLCMMGFSYSWMVELSV